MKGLQTTVIAALAAGGWVVATSCGGDTDDGVSSATGSDATGDSGATDTGADATRESPYVDDQIYIVGEGEPVPCPGFDPYRGIHCGWQITLPNGVDFGSAGGEGGGGGAGGAAGAGGTPAAACEIPLAFEVVVPYTVRLVVDCEAVFYSSPDQGEESWQYDDPETPTTVLLSEALCSRLEQDGFERIDLDTGSCPPPGFF